MYSAVDRIRILGIFGRERGERSWVLKMFLEAQAAKWSLPFPIASKIWSMRMKTNTSAKQKQKASPSFVCFGYISQ